MNLSVDLSPAQRVAYLQTLPAIRERCNRVYALAGQGKLEHFDYHPEKESDVVDFCIEIIQVGPIYDLSDVDALTGCTRFVFSAILVRTILL
jgi:hypothetical protein